MKCTSSKVSRHEAVPVEGLADALLGAVDPAALAQERERLARVHLVSRVARRALAVLLLGLGEWVELAEDLLDRLRAAGLEAVPLPAVPGAGPEEVDRVGDPQEGTRLDRRLSARIGFLPVARAGQREPLLEDFRIAERAPVGQGPDDVSEVRSEDRVAEQLAELRSLESVAVDHRALEHLLHAARLAAELLGPRFHRREQRVLGVALRDALEALGPAHHLELGRALRVDGQRQRHVVAPDLDRPVHEVGDGVALHRPGEALGVRVARGPREVVEADVHGAPLAFLALGAELPRLLPEGVQALVAHEQILRPQLAPPQGNEPEGPHAVLVAFLVDALPHLGELERAAHRVGEEHRALLAALGRRVLRGVEERLPALLAEGAAGA
ncbi:MAG: hypothetical protein AAFP86_03840, partial [Planctomycetota bacterium]